MSEVQPADAYDDSEFPLESSFAKFVAEDQPRFPFSADLLIKIILRNFVQFQSKKYIIMNSRLMYSIINFRFA